MRALSQPSKDYTRAVQTYAPSMSNSTYSTLGFCDIKGADMVVVAEIKCKLVSHSDQPISIFQ